MQKKDTSHGLLYAEIGIERLSSRRKIENLVQFFKTVNHFALVTLTEILPLILIEPGTR